MSDNMIAEGLLLLVAQRRAEIDAQNTCTHPTTRTKDDFNYHTREVWVETYCTICNKRLSRE